MDDSVLWKNVTSLKCKSTFIDEVDLANHINKGLCPALYHKRVKQNLKFVDFEEDSEDEWTPSNDDEQLFIEDGEYNLVQDSNVV